VPEGGRRKHERIAALMTDDRVRLHVVKGALVLVMPD
jgi:hypothetical protein